MNNPYRVHHQRHAVANFAGGLYAEPAAAAQVRDCLALLLYGKFTRLNFPRKAGRRYGSG